MIMNKDTKEHTCNACNTELIKVLCLKYHIKTEDVNTAILQPAKKPSLYIATQIVSQ